jgi:hypothetical protein
MEGVLDELEHPVARVGLILCPIHHAHAGKLRWVPDHCDIADDIDLQSRQLDVEISVERAGKIPVRRFGGGTLSPALLSVGRITPSSSRSVFVAGERRLRIASIYRTVFRNPAS